MRDAPARTAVTLHYSRLDRGRRSGGAVPERGTGDYKVHGISRVLPHCRLRCWVLPSTLRIQMGAMLWVDAEVRGVM